MTRNMQPNPNPTVLIVCATGDERGLLFENMRAYKEWVAQESELTPPGVSSWVRGTEKLLVVEGGQTQARMKENVPRTLRELRQWDHEVGLIMLVGTCGAIKDLRVGQVIVPKVIQVYDTLKGGLLLRTGSTLSPTSRLVDRTQEVDMTGIVASTGQIATTMFIVESPELAKLLGEQGNLAVESEAYGFFLGLEEFDKDDSIDRLVIRAAMESCSDRDQPANWEQAMKALMPVVMKFADVWLTSARLAQVDVSGGCI